MRAYMMRGDHRIAMPHLLEWCDEASVVHWNQDDDILPSWTEADRRMRGEGRPSKVRHPSIAHATLAYHKPRTTGAGPIRPVRWRSPMIGGLGLVRGPSDLPEWRSSDRHVANGAGEHRLTAYCG